MNMSRPGIELLRHIEGFRSYAYDDQTGDDIEVWVPGATIGFGHLISESEWPRFCGRIINEKEANAIFLEDLAPFESCVMGAIENAWHLADCEFDALVILAFNIGQRAFHDSSLVKMINDDGAITVYPSIERAWKAWDKSQGKVMRGLVNRRAAEWNMYRDGIYERW